MDEFEGGVRLRQPTERTTNIQKSMELRLEPDRAALTVQHSLHNIGLWPVELAPWAITQVPLGGVAVLPQQAPVPSQYLPNRFNSLAHAMAHPAAPGGRSALIDGRPMSLPSRRLLQPCRLEPRWTTSSVKRFTPQLGRPPTYSNWRLTSAPFRLRRAWTTGRATVHRDLGAAPSSALPTIDALRIRPVARPGMSASYPCPPARHIAAGFSAHAGHRCHRHLSVAAPGEWNYRRQHGCLSGRGRALYCLSR